ncbi:MAG: serine hydrolase [Woeseiaceae bacterium]
MEQLLQSQPKRFATVMADPDKYRVQIIYTQIDRDAANRPSFTSHTYGVDPARYFYPASTVKLPTALLALEKVNDLAIPGLTRDTTMLTGVASDWQTPALTDASSPSGLPSIGHYIRKILLVSDNDAFNRLYEFIGQQPLNESMHEKGYRNTRIFHRLEVARNAAENAITNPVTFVDGDTVVYTQAAQTSDADYAHDEPILLGRAEIVNGERLDRPKDFSGNNVFPLQDQHDVMQALMFPQYVTEQRRFRLTEDDYRFVYRNMSAYPGKSGIAEYTDPAQYPDGYVKFLMYGGSAATIPDNIRIFNKPGDAYGFLTDCAYIVDFEHGVEFLLAATIYTNENGTFNDDTYEYDEIALPFLRDLGMAIYEIERAREREYAPDLGRFHEAVIP